MYVFLAEQTKQENSNQFQSFLFKNNKKKNMQAARQSVTHARRQCCKQNDYNLKKKVKEQEENE